MSEVPGVVELRRYALHPGARETLIELFEREFVEPQEAVGMQVLGQFRDLDDPDAFVWLRGYRDMASRARGLAAFYGGPVWREHRDAANATMIDSDNVLLLRPLEWRGLRRAGAGGLVFATLCPLAEPAEPAFAPDVDVIATFVTEHSPNNFPALPVREGEEFFVWLSHAEFDVPPALAGRTEPETWRLEPTARSLLR